jgi:hypothetical protein
MAVSRTEYCSELQRAEGSSPKPNDQVLMHPLCFMKPPILGLGSRSKTASRGIGFLSLKQGVRPRARRRSLRLSWFDSQTMPEVPASFPARC